jgi:two-component system sensor histidine kinase EvgS
MIYKHRPPQRAVTLLISLFILLFSCGISFASHLNDSSQPAAVSPVVSSASEYDYPPYCTVTPDGQADGFSVELLQAALKAMGHDVSFEVGPWAQVKQLLVDGKVQVLPLVGRTPEREHDYDFTFPYLKMHGTIVVRKGENGIRGLADLKGEQIAVLKGDNAEEFLRRSNLGATIVTTTTFDEALRQLHNGEHDAVVVQKLVALQLIRKHDLTNLKTVGPPLEDFVQSFCFAVKKGDHRLLNLLNEGLSIAVADGTFKSLYKKWFGPIEALAFTKSRIVVGGDDNYPPYEFLDENGQPAGYNVDLTRAIAKQTGIEVDIQLGPWAEIRAELDSGVIDVLQGMSYSRERDAAFDFTPAHTILSHVIVVRQGTPPPRSMADLAGKSILVADGDLLHDIAVKMGYAKQLVLVKSQEEALEKLASGQYDSALVGKILALYSIEKYGWKNLRISEHSVFSSEYCYAVSDRNSVLLSRLAEGLAVVKATGEYHDIYSRWLGVYEKPIFGFYDFLKYSFFIIVPLIVVLIGSFFWSWSLKRKVKMATAQLQDERRRLESIIEGTRAGTWEWNIQTGESLLNSVWAEMIGYTLEEISPVSIASRKKYAHSDDLQKSRECLEAYFQNETDFYECEFRMKHKDGHWVWILSRGKVSSWTSDGKPLWMFGTHINITASKQAGEEREQLIAELQEKTAEQERFIYTISHDLKSPLITISGFLDLIERNFAAGDEIGFKSNLEVVSKASDRMGQLLSELLDLSRIGVIKNPVETVNLEVLIMTAIETVSGQINRAGVSIKVPENLPNVLVDAKTFLQVFENLISNAAKFSSAADGGGVINIGVRHEAGELVCDIQDNGIGIEPCYLDKVFGLFEKLDSLSKGTGVGLAIVKRVVEIHGGRIWVESKGVGHGSTFSFTLPEVSH